MALTGIIHAQRPPPLPYLLSLLLAAQLASSQVDAGRMREESDVLAGMVAAMRSELAGKEMLQQEMGSMQQELAGATQRLQVGAASRRARSCGPAPPSLPPPSCNSSACGSKAGGSCGACVACPCVCPRSLALSARTVLSPAMWPSHMCVPQEAEAQSGLMAAQMEGLQAQMATMTHAGASNDELVSPAWVLY